MLIDKPLSKSQVKLLESQIKRYSFVKDDIEYSNNKQIINRNGKLILEKGTLIHGTFFDKDVLRKISKYGILACEIFDEHENGETYYCADFFRIPRTQTMEEYHKFCQEKEIVAGFEKNKMETKKLPVLRPMNIGFIVNNDIRIHELLSYDPYRGNLEVQEIVNQKELKDTGLYKNRERLAAILVGLPANCISGIWIGEKVREDKAKIEQLKELFRRAYIVTSDGNLLYKPTNGLKQENTER